MAARVVSPGLPISASKPLRDRVTLEFEVANARGASWLLDELHRGGSPSLAFLLEERPKVRRNNTIGVKAPRKAEHQLAAQITSMALEALDAALDQIEYQIH